MSDATSNSYDQPVKIHAREKVLSAAVAILTENRRNAPLVQRDYVRRVRDQIRDKGVRDPCKQKAALLTDSAIERWEIFHDSIVQQKSAKDLSVAFLCGPRPENDVAELIRLGVLEENIWAFENDNETYDQAVLNSLNSKFPFLKIFKGGIDSFLSCSRQRFDIIYLDFCGRMVSNSKSSHGTIASVLTENSLNQNGVLITNVSFPPDIAPEQQNRDNLFNLACFYLFNKERVDGEILSESGWAYPDWKAKFANDNEGCYSLFLTRLLMDLGLVCAPTARFFNSTTNGKPIFNFEVKSLLESAKLLMAVPTIEEVEAAESTGDDADFWFGAAATSEGGKYSLVRTIHGLLKAESIFGPDGVPDRFQRLAKRFVSQLNPKNDSDFPQKIQSLIYLLSSDHRLKDFEYLPDTTKRLVESHSSNSYHQFCDVVCQHQILELLFCQLSFPYHFNVAESKRWKYRAVGTDMFMDMAVFDQCRYVYDWMPTLDMYAFGMSDVERQLSYRFALDGIRKHSFEYNSEFLAGTHIVPVHLDGFRSKELPVRLELTGP